MSDPVPENSGPDLPGPRPTPEAGAARPNRSRRRGSRGGARNRPRPDAASAAPAAIADTAPAASPEGVKPKIGDSRPAPPFTPRFPPPSPPTKLIPAPAAASPTPPPAGGPPAAPGSPVAPSSRIPAPAAAGGSHPPSDAPPKKRRRRGGRGRGSGGKGPAQTVRSGGTVAEIVPDPLDAELIEQRRGRERKGRPVGRYLMCVHVQEQTTHIAVLEGRSLIEHYVSRPQDDVNQIDGNIYLGRVQNVLPGMEAAFIEIATPKNAVLYRGDVRYDRDDVEGDEQKNTARDGDGPPISAKSRGWGPGGDKANGARIEQLLRPGQSVLCQVTKNPIGHKGARLTQEVSLPGRFLVLVPNCDTYGISKRLPDNERKRLRKVLDEVRPPGHGLIVRTAAEGATADELRRDLTRLQEQWEAIDRQAKRSKAPALLYCEPDLAVRIIREEFNRDYRGVIIDDLDLYNDVRAYVASISPELADRVEYFDRSADPLPLYERHHVHEQLHRALDRKVWLPSGGSLIIERTEALTVIDVNTGKNVGTSNLEETVYRNNLEAAEEVARQLRLRDIGGIIVIDFIDMEITKNRNDVNRAFREYLARDKTRTQVFDISELGLVQMTRKRVSEGLVESFSSICPTCDGRGMIIDEDLLSS